MLAKKRIISVILSFVMVIGMCTTTFAAESIPNVAGITQEDYMKEIEDTIKEYISACDINTSDLSMSQPMPINGSNDENSRALFLFSGMKCIALMMFTYVNNEYASSFSEGDYVEISDALSENQNVAFVSNEESMVMLTDNSWEVVNGSEDFAQKIVMNEILTGYEKQPLNLTPIIFSDEIVVYDARSYAGKTLSVPQVKNKKSPDTGIGLCWAASMVSIIRYRTGENNLTIDSLYEMLKKKYPSDGYPSGACKWPERCFSWYDLSYTHTHSGFSYYEVQPIIQKSRPIYGVLKRAGGSHAVVIAGYKDNGENYYYEVMDPGNKKDNSKMLLKLPDPTTNAFTYVSPNAFTYSSWICRMY